MEITNNNSALLSNIEVLKILRENQENKARMKSNKNLATITYETIKYLQDSPACQIKPNQMIRFLNEIKDKFRLTKFEKLQIINHRPQTVVELQLLVEENEERFSEDAMQRLLDSVKQHLIDDQSENESEQKDE